MLAKTYKTSNKQLVESIDKKDEFKKYLGNLIEYCDKMFEFENVNGNSILENIVSNNEHRTHNGQI